MTVTVVGGPRALPEPLTAIIRRAHAAHVWRSRSRGRWSVADTRLDRLHRAATRLCRHATPPRYEHQFVKNVPSLDHARA